MKYFAVNTGDDWIKFTISPEERFIKILDSYNAEYLSFDNSRELFSAKRKYHKFKGKDLIYDFRKYPTYIVVGKDGTFYTYFCEPVVFETLFDKLGIEYYKFENTKSEEYKAKMKELSARARS